MFRLSKKEKSVLFDTNIEILQEHDKLRMKNDGVNLCEEVIEFTVRDFCTSILPNRGAEQ